MRRPILGFNLSKIGVNSFGEGLTYHNQQAMAGKAQFDDVCAGSGLEFFKTLTVAF
jgi:hypothetical protein